MRTMRKAAVLIGGLMVVSAVMAEDDTCDPLAAVEMVQYGQRVVCSIDSAGDADLFHLAGSSGDRLRVSFGKLFDSPDIYSLSRFEICAQVTAPDGSIARSPGCEGGAGVDILLELDGIYTIDVSDNYHNDGGQYDMSVICAGGPCLTADGTGSASAGGTSCTAGEGVATFYPTDGRLHIPTLNVATVFGVSGEQYEVELQLDSTLGGGYVFGLSSAIPK